MFEEDYHVIWDALVGSLNFKPLPLQRVVIWSHFHENKDQTYLG